jgi:hypothetical protein
MNAMNFGAVGATAYVINPATVEEMVVGTGGVSAESEASGIMMNMIPKEGGNTFRGSVSGFYGILRPRYSISSVTGFRSRPAITGTGRATFPRPAFSVRV